MTSIPKPEPPVNLEIKFEYFPADMPKIVAETCKGMQFHNIQLVIITSYFIIFMVADMGIALVAMLLNDGSITIASPNLIIRFVIGIAILLASELVLMLIAKSSTRKAYSTPGKNGLFCEHTIELNDRGFVETTGVNSNFHAWEGVESIKETENYLTIQVRLGAGYSIPKRAFANDQALKQFADTAQNLIRTANEVTT